MLVVSAAGGFDPKMLGGIVESLLMGVTGLSLSVDYS